MISLISRWKLKNGCPDALNAALQDLARDRNHLPGAGVRLLSDL